MTTHVSHWLELLHRDQAAKLRGQVRDGLQVRDLPVEEAAQVRQTSEFEGEKLTVQSEIVLGVELLLIVESLRDQHVLTGVDHLIDLALDVTQLLLLASELVWLLELLNLALKVANSLAVCSVLQLKVIVVLDQGLHLLFERILVHGS